MSHEELHVLWVWLEENGKEPDTACFLERPWHWETEYLQMLAERAQDEAA
jgi:hypothetical protein